MSAQGTLELARVAPIRSTTRRRTRETPLLVAGLVLADGVALGLAFALAYLLRFKTGIPFLETPPHYLGFYSLFTFWAIPLWLAVFAFFRLYDRFYLFAGFQEYTRVVNACTFGLMATILVSFLDQSLLLSRGWLLLVCGLSVLLVSSTRFAIRRLLRNVRARGFLIARTVIVGANEEGRALAEQFQSDPGSGTRIVGFVDPSLTVGTSGPGQLVVLGGMRDLEQIVREQDIQQIVVAMTAITRDDLLDLYRTLGHDEDVEIRLSSGLFEILTTGVRVQEISFVSLMTPQRVRITGVDAALKTGLDYLGAALILLILSPILMIIALLVALDSPGPAIYRRRVLGRGGNGFDAFKFRTMVTDAEAVLAANEALREAFETGYKLPEDPRVTRIGRFLRRTSLDELPQLLNVLRGEMSLVGPRMIAPDEAIRYGKWQVNLLTVKPGITGPWQVHGRSDIPYEERVRLSTHYIRNYNIWLDLEILLRTVPAVLMSRGAY